uniref:RHS repeat domain-containing protein n=1 Tax=uncultured Aquimarina sp. TaxID=575652 RepID=UPI00260A60DF
YAPFSNNYVSDYKMGKPKSVKIFNMCNKLLQKTEYTYDSAAVFSSPGISVNNNENNRYNYLMYLQSENGSVYTGLVEGRLSCLGNGCEDRVIYEYAGVPFICLSENAIGRPSNLIECNGEKTAAMMQARGKSVNGRIGFMSSETQVRYFDTDSIKSHTYYTYNEHSKYLLKERKVQLQGDQTTKEVFYYPRDLTTNNFPDADIFNTEETNAVEGLLDQNKHVVPIRVDVFNGQQLLSSKITSYQSVGNTFYPKTIKLAKGTNPYEARMEFLEYSSKGKPTKISIENEKLFLYTYGYNGRYLTEAIQGVPMDMADSVTPSTSILDVYPEAHITSYTYNLLGKPTEIEDPRGLKIQYIYDKFYRLTKVKDQSGNILSENQYNYINN